MESFYFPFLSVFFSSSFCSFLLGLCVCVLCCCCCFFVFFGVGVNWLVFFLGVFLLAWL